MYKCNSLKNLVALLGIMGAATGLLKAQDGDTSLIEHTRNFYVGIHAHAVKDFGKQANFFRGYGTFGIDDLLAIPQVQSELYTRTGKNFSLAEYPSPMRYNTGVGAGIDLLYNTGDVNLVLNGSFCKLTTSGVFTLSATDPANPAGDDIIRTQSIEGVERRTWIKAGIQIKNAINYRSDFYIELAPVFFVQRAVSNMVNIEGSTYSILVQNPGFIPVRTGYNGYGLSGGLGAQALFKSNKMVQLGVNASLSKLNMVKVKGLNLMGELYLSVFL